VDVRSCDLFVGKRVPWHYLDAFVLSSVGGIELFGVVRSYEVVFLAVNEEGRDVCLLDVLSDGVQILDAEVVLTSLNPT
jgi:hypothetical protein